MVVGVRVEPPQGKHPHSGIGSSATEEEKIIK